MKALPIVAALALGACATGSAEDVASPPPPTTVAPPATVSPAPTADTCGARAVQNLVGRPRSEIPVPVNPSRQRVACTTCPVTLDYSPQRLNFFFDADTGIIREIRCG